MSFNIFLTTDPKNREPQATGLLCHPPHAELFRTRATGPQGGALYAMNALAKTFFWRMGTP